MTHPWLFAASIGLLMAFVAFTTYRSGQLLRYWTPSGNLLLSWPDNLMRLALVGLCAVLGVTLGPGLLALGWSTANLGADLAWGAAIGLLMTSILTGAGWVIERRWGAEVASTRLIRCILPINRREWAGVLLALLPAAALEELLFRSLPLGGLTWLVQPWWLMWPLALFFGVLHWPQGAWGVVGTTLAAIALSLLFLVTGSIWAVLAAHYVFNVMQVIAARWMGLRPLRAAEPIAEG
jgi:membrane protease YdiL (CAAX protease family)